MFEHIEVLAFALVPFITVITQVIKKTNIVPSQITPLVTLIVGVALGLITIPLTGTGAVTALLVGIASAGMAMGTFDVAKSFQGEDNDG